MEDLPFDPAAGLLGLLRMEIRELTADRCVITWRVGPEHLQPFGLVHGGVHCSAVETAASLAAGTWFRGKGHVVGVSNQTDFLRGVREGELTATATPIHRGRLQQLWLVEITDDAGQAIARGQVRLQNLESRGDR